MNARQENILIYKTVHTPASAQFPFYKSQINLEIVHMQIRLISPFTRHHPTINGTCNAPHECWCTEISLLINYSLQ